MTKEELEKEAKEYADWFWGASPSMMKALAEVYIKGAEPREKRIADLEKENAELKEKLKPENCLKLLAKEGYVKFSSDQLTYAKTIIQDLLDNTDEYARQRAEDFLKESE